jgi:hypothetical protein
VPATTVIGPTAAALEVAPPELDVDDDDELLDDELPQALSATIEASTKAVVSADLVYLLKTVLLLEVCRVPLEI